MIGDTKRNLGMSQEAFELLHAMRPSHDDIGDVDLWKCADGTTAFAWFGGFKHIIKMSNASASRNFNPDACVRDFIQIPNDSSDPDAVKAVRAAQMKDKP